MKIVRYLLNLPWTLIGLFLALISIPRRVRFANDAIIFNVRSFWWKRMIWYMKDRRVRAIANGNVVSLGPLEEENDLHHELVHVEQYMRKPFVQPFFYAVEVFKHGASPKNKYEEEAYRVSNSVYRGKPQEGSQLIL